MELREFAERVLFATTLEEKLRAPGVISDEQPGSAVPAPAAPGRPSHLQFKQRGRTATADFPGTGRLENQRDRGRLLHFFANHELLATELMALVLLRFPEAPAAFRRGVLQTLLDEQEHTRLYLERMRECGIEFGELPVSGYFWRCVAPMESPADFVAGLSLTFEQANLDFARHFARAFEQAGDAASAALLERIYRDEIGHVAHGLKWFRRWKNPGESDWEAFCRQLKFPLSPRRARGFSLNVEARRAAGLDAAFIAELAVCSQSKGRTPGVFVFNPFAEGFMARGRAFTPNKHQSQLAGDLENLPQFLCRQDDVVLVRRRPSVEFLSGLQQAGFPLPEFLEYDPAAGLARVEALGRRKLGGLRPWAWGPDSVELLGPLFAQVTGEPRSSDGRFNERVAELYSKAWSAEFLRKVLHRMSKTELAERGAGRWLCSKREIGVAARTMAEALAIIGEIRGRGHHRVVVKEAFGLAGGNALRLWEPELLETHRRWMASALEDGQTLVIEPWLEREIDFSVQLEMRPAGLRLCGYTGLINDRKGQFLANWAEPDFVRRPPAAVVASLRGAADGALRLHEFYQEILDMLEAELRSAGFLGPISLDAFLYRTADGSIRLKPVVEINPRYTMGRLTIELMQRVCPGSHGIFRLMNHARLRQEGIANFAALAAELQRRFPLRLEGDPVPRIREGLVCLNDAATARACLAVFQAGRGLVREAERSGDREVERGAA